MNVLIIYDSIFGNTQRIAQIIAEQFQTTHAVHCLRADNVTQRTLQQASVVLAGCPTQWCQPTPGMQHFLKHLLPGTLEGKMVAAFDTRYKMDCGLSGAAAWTLARTLQQAGASLVLPPESFFVYGEMKRSLL